MYGLTHERNATISKCHHGRHTGKERKEHRRSRLDEHRRHHLPIFHHLPRELSLTKPVAVDGLRNAEWVAMDYTDIIVHVFLPQTREFYDIEHLWEDAQLTALPDID